MRFKKKKIQKKKRFETRAGGEKWRERLCIANRSFECAACLALYLVCACATVCELRASWSEVAPSQQKGFVCARIAS